jgi:hypothetical protein
MSEYAIRVELRGNPSYEEYEKLHALMTKKGFVRTIVGSDGKSYSLPHATYWGSSPSDVGSVRNTIRNAVKSEIQDSIIVFVVQSSNWALGW